MDVLALSVHTALKVETILLAEWWICQAEFRAL